MIRQVKDQRSQRHESLNQHRLMKRRCSRPLAHCGRMTKPELICHLIAAVLGKWTHLQPETEKGSARGRRTKPFGGCAFRKHRRSSASLLLPGSPIFLHDGGLVDPQLRASNEGLLRPRVARARKIISLHPLLCSPSKRTTRPPSSPITWRTPHLLPPPPAASTPGCNTLHDPAPMDRRHSPPPEAPRLILASFATARVSWEKPAAHDH